MSLNSDACAAFVAFANTFRISYGADFHTLSAKNVKQAAQNVPVEDIETYPDIDLYEKADLSWSNEAPLLKKLLQQSTVSRQLVLDKILSLRLVSRKIDHVDDKMLSFHFLTELSLTGNWLNEKTFNAKYLPPTLELLFLNANRFTQIPNVSNLIQLQHLSLSHNPITLTAEVLNSQPFPESLLSLDLSATDLENISTLVQLLTVSLPNLSVLACFETPISLKANYRARFKSVRSLKFLDDTRLLCKEDDTDDDTTSLSILLSNWSFDEEKLLTDVQELRPAVPSSNDKQGKAKEIKKAPQKDSSENDDPNRPSDMYTLHVSFQLDTPTTSTTPPRLTFEKIQDVLCSLSSTESSFTITSGPLYPPLPETSTSLIQKDVSVSPSIQTRNALQFGAVISASVSRWTFLKKAQQVPAKKGKQEDLYQVAYVSSREIEKQRVSLGEFLKEGRMEVDVKFDIGGLNGVLKMDLNEKRAPVVVTETQQQ